MSSKTLPFMVVPATGPLDLNGGLVGPESLTQATNIEYLENGERSRRLGMALYNTSTNPALSSGGAFRAIADYWRYGATLTPTQHYVALVGNSIVRSTGDGKWLTLTATSSLGAAQAYASIMVAGDLALFLDDRVISNDQSTTLTVVQFGAAAGQARAAAYHNRRAFYGAQANNPDVISYSASTDPANVAAANTFPVGTGDGDAVIGLSQTWHKRLYIFKGAQRGGIYELTGNTPISWQLNKVTHGAPCVNGKTIITTPTDIFWMSRYGIHSLSATVQYGDIEPGFISFPIQKYLRDVLDYTAVGNSWGFWNPMRGTVGWFIQTTSASFPSVGLVYNYGLSDPKPGGAKYWSIWTLGDGALLPTAGGVIITASSALGNVGPSQQKLYIGLSTSTLLVADQASSALGSPFADGGPGYTATVQTGYLNQFPALGLGLGDEKIFEDVLTVQHAPTSHYHLPTLTINVDGSSQGLTTSLNAVSSVGDSNPPIISETRVGIRGRSIQLNWVTSGANRDMVIAGYGVRMTRAESLGRDREPI